MKIRLEAHYGNSIRAMAVTVSVQGVGLRPAIDFVGIRNDVNVILGGSSIIYPRAVCQP